MKRIQTKFLESIIVFCFKNVKNSSEFFVCDINICSIEKVPKLRDNLVFFYISIAMITPEEVFEVLSQDRYGEFQPYETTLVEIADNLDEEKFDALFIQLKADIDLSEDEKAKHFDSLTNEDKIQYYLNEFHRDSKLSSPEFLLRSIQANRDPKLFEILYAQLLSNRKQYRRKLLQNGVVGLLLNILPKTTNEAIQRLIIQSIQAILESNLFNEELITDAEKQQIFSTLSRIYLQPTPRDFTELENENRRLKKEFKEYQDAKHLSNSIQHENQNVTKQVKIYQLNLERYKREHEQLLKEIYELENGPYSKAKQEIEQLNREIEEKSAELIELRSKHYSKVHSKLKGQINELRGQVKPVNPKRHVSFVFNDETIPIVVKEIIIPDQNDVDLIEEEEYDDNDDEPIQPMIIEPSHEPDFMPLPSSSSSDSEKEQNNGVVIRELSYSDSDQRNLSYSSSDGRNRDFTSSDSDPPKRPSHRISFPHSNSDSDRVISTDSDNEKQKSNSSSSDNDHHKTASSDSDNEKCQKITNDENGIRIADRLSTSSSNSSDSDHEKQKTNTSDNEKHATSSSDNDNDKHKADSSDKENDNTSDKEIKNNSSDDGNDIDLKIIQALIDGEFDVAKPKTPLNDIEVNVKIIKSISDDENENDPSISPDTNEPPTHLSTDSEDDKPNSSGNENNQTRNQKIYNGNSSDDNNTQQHNIDSNEQNKSDSNDEKVKPLSESSSDDDTKNSQSQSSSDDLSDDDLPSPSDSSSDKSSQDSD